MASLRIQMLGPFRVWRGGEQIPDEAWPTQKSKSLLKILLIERGRMVPVDRLLDLLWPDLPPDKAQNNLWVTVSQVRRILQPESRKRGASDYILKNHEGYSFNPQEEVWLDVEAFGAARQEALKTSGAEARLVALEAARKLYSGDFLEEDPYEDWASGPRERLQEEYLSLLEELAEGYARAGQYRRAAGLGREILARERTRESAYRRLMLYLYAAGEQQQALQVYTEAREVLMEELGVEPDQETRELYRQIEQRMVEAVDRYRQYPPARRLDPGAALLGQIAFVGRGQEFGQMAVLLEEALHQRKGRLVLIEGEPGIGKSRLVQETGSLARERGMRSLVVNCYAIERSTPFQPVIELVDQLSRQWPECIYERMPPAALAEVAALAPEIAERLPDLPVLQGGLDEARQARLFKALSQIVAYSAGDEGLFLVIDDLHWADYASLKFFHQLARSISEEPVLLVYTYRAEEIGEDESLAALVRSLKREPGTRSLRLARLNEEEVREIITPLAQDRAAELARLLHAETEGNPFFLVTMLQSLVEQGLLARGDADDQPEGQNWKEVLRLEGGLELPEALRESIRDRLSRASRPARQILDVAAVVGRRFQFNTLQQASGESPEGLLEILEDLLARRLLREREDGRHFDFNHDKIREVVYADISQARRAYLHRQVAGALEQLTTASVEEYAGTLAEHFEKGGIWTKAIAYLHKAAERSRRLYALQEALHFYDRAISLAQAHPEAAEPGVKRLLYEGRGETRMQLGLFQEASSDLHLALDAARESSDHGRERALLISLGTLCRREDDYQSAMQYLNQALEVARSGCDDSNIADALYHLGTVTWSMGNNRQTEAYHREAVAICRQLGLTDLVAAQAYHGLGEALWLGGDFYGARDLFLESIELAQKAGDKGLLNENYHNLGAIHTDQLYADYGKAEEYLRKALAFSREAHLTWHTIPSLFILGYVLGSRGDYSTGIRYLRQSIQEAEQLRSPRYHSVALDFLGCLYRDLEMMEAAEAAHAAGLQISLESKAGFWLPRLQANLAIDRIRQGRLDVEADLQTALENAQANGLTIHAAVALQGLAELSVLRGETHQALNYTGQLLEISRSGMRERTAQAQRWRGEAFMALGDLEGASAALEEAALLAGEIERPRLVWKIEEALARLRREQGQMEAAAEHQSHAEELIARVRENVGQDLQIGLLASG